MKPRRLRLIGPIAVASAGLLSGCYYYPYGYYPWGYPNPYLYTAGYPYAAGYPYPPTPAAVPPHPGQPVVGTPQPPNAPIQRAPLPPAPQ
ncbi:MAG TPA: hypothetical protein VKF83_06905 [Stellaceae bacterium]|nr:hypothetical protein [Stellaceae bacterium]